MGFKSQILLQSCKLACAVVAAGLFSAAACAEQANPYGPQFGGSFKVLTTEIFPSSDHHLTDRLRFPDVYEGKQRLSQDYGIDWAILSAPVFQAGTGADTTYTDNEVDVLFSWRFFENERTTGRIFFYGIWVQTLGNLPTGAFAKSQGVTTAPNSGGTDPDKSFVSPSALWWEQSFSSGLRYRIGQLWSTNLWANNEFYGDDRANFMNSLMGGGAGVPWIGGNRGLGAMVALEKPWGHLAIGFQDSKADQQKIDFSSFRDGKFSYLAEAAFNTGSTPAKAGEYKLTLGYVDENGLSGANALPAGYGLNVSGQQRLGNGYALFGFFRKSWKRFAANVDTGAAIGATMLEPFGWKDDNLSAAFFFSKPADTQGGALRDEYGIETFWRFQITPRLDVTPNAVIYLQPGRVTQKDPVAVFGLRLRFIL